MACREAAGRVEPKLMRLCRRHRHRGPGNTYWSGNVLDLLLAQIVKHKGQSIANVVVNRIEEHPAGVGQGFDPRSDVDAVPIEVVAFNDHIAEVDADT